MAVFFPNPITTDYLKSQKTETVKFNWWKDFKGGFETENLPTMIYQHMIDNSDFVPEDNYIPSQDPQLQGYENHMHLFYFSQSRAETSAIINKYKKHQELNYASPWHYIGKITGAVLDPSTALFFTKFGQAAKIVGTSMVAEEIGKQNLDPLRSDSYLPLIAAYGYSIPFLLNKLSAAPGLKTQQKIKAYDEQWISNTSSKTSIKEGDIAIDGTFVKPNKTDPSPSAVGSQAVSQPVKTTAQQRMTGEKFIETNLKWFGENGPWTPVFRVINQNTSLTARKIMGDLLDTPLLKLKNTKAWGFNATGKSIETDMRMMRVGEIESHKMIKDQYLKYVQRQQLETGATVPSTDFMMMFKNRGKDAQSQGWLNQTQFSKEITIARLNSFDHAIPEVAEAARITQKKVYEPLFKEANLLKIRELPVESELKFWQDTLKDIRKKGLGSRTFKSKYGDPDEVYSISRIESTIDKLTERLKRIQKGKGVKDYINIVYIKNAIDKNKDHFRGIIERFYQRQGIQINKADLDQLVKDLSNHFPFVKPRKGDYDVNQRYVFKDPRYARANRARELNLDKQAQLELIEAGMIMSDIFALQKIYARQMIPDILLTRKYGDPNGLGFKFIEDNLAPFESGLMTVANEYNVKIAMGKKVNRSKLLKERDQILDDLEAAIELIKGTYGLPANPHAWTSTAMRTAKHYNALTMLTGFFAAIPDVARITMTSGIKRGFATQFEMLGNFLGDGKLFKMGKKEAQSFGEAVDMVTGQRAMLFADVGDMFGLANRLEGAMGKVSAINFMYVNLMSRWTEMAKSMASVTIGSRIIEDSISWSKGTLGDKWKTALSSSGIDKDMARRIAVQFEQYGEKTKHNFMANTSQWKDAQAIDAFGAALNKDINITIVTPGLGDTPKWMSTELGSTFAQFKKFAMSATQRMLMRGMQERDLDFLFGAMLLMGSGMLIDSVYHKFRFNRDYSKLSLTQKLLNAFDRSGLAGIYTDVNKAIETLSDNRIGISPILGEKRPYGSSGRWKAGTMFGPTGGQIYNIADILFDVGGNKYNPHTAKNVRRLIPFQNVWYLDWLFDDIQKGLN